ncbi:UrcA family protein [uncultured Sphingomonas sp.]|uniref:UrcA family protein n=1 Tax=uncultured Sphingomonas sp. TaxID=158754 RepID=UPI0025E85F4D|nr:UrcA family protein [uncultured Sphingomonas sp.]
MKIFTAAAFAASLFASVAVHAEERETVSMTVRHGDLDLRRADHRAQLDARIRRAAMIACGTVTADLRQNDDIARCRREMTADAAVKVAALSPSRVQLASNR